LELFKPLLLPIVPWWEDMVLGLLFLTALSYTGQEQQLGDQTPVGDQAMAVLSQKVQLRRITQTNDNSFDSGFERIAG